MLCNLRLNHDRDNLSSSLRMYVYLHIFGIKDTNFMQSVFVYSSAYEVSAHRYCTGFVRMVIHSCRSSRHTAVLDALTDVFVRNVH